MALDEQEQAGFHMVPRSSVHPEGRFQFALHRPSYAVANLRANDRIDELGRFEDGRPVTNRRNFPAGPLDVPVAGGVYEIANPFPFRGTTYIGRDWAEARRDPSAGIHLPRPDHMSMTRWIREHLTGGSGDASPSDLIKRLPEAVQLAVAVNSTDPEDLVALAEAAGAFVHDPGSGMPVGLRYTVDGDGMPRPRIRNHLLFEAVANNAHLPYAYKDAMVLRPGVQGGSEIVGEWEGDGGSHVFEYLRRNSYIPWGHYAANMANDAVRYDAEALTDEDITGMRHLYYQRTYWRLAEMTGIDPGPGGRILGVDDLEALRRRILERLGDPQQPPRLALNGGLWGWNFGFDYAPSRYRLHASHQQIHQQYALVPRCAPAAGPEAAPGVDLPAYACGDQIHAFIQDYRRRFGRGFFEAYIQALRTNRRTDGRNDAEASLIVYGDAHVLLFVPKAQTSQWELQILVRQPVGNILEADGPTRRSLDRALWIAFKTLGRMGARMVTTIEYAKRFDAGETGQHLLYSLLPRLPESPGAFSEAQLRWIVGHYPEDFATACRAHMPAVDPPSGDMGLRV